MTKYKIVKTEAEIYYKMRYKIKQGCTLDDSFAEIVKIFATLEKAKNEFPKFNTDIWEVKGNTGIWYLINEYSLVKTEYDADSEIINSDILDISKMSIAVIADEGFDTLATFDNYIDAENYIENHIEEQEVHLLFC